MGSQSLLSKTQLTITADQETGIQCVDPWYNRMYSLPLVLSFDFVAVDSTLNQPIINAGPWCFLIPFQLEHETLVEAQSAYIGPPVVELHFLFKNIRPKALILSSALYSLNLVCFSSRFSLSRNLWRESLSPYTPELSHHELKLLLIPISKDPHLHLMSIGCTQPTYQTAALQLQARGCTVT